MPFPNTNPAISKGQVTDWIDATKRDLSRHMKQASSSETRHLIEIDFEEVKRLTIQLERLEWLAGIIITAGK